MMAHRPFHAERIPGLIGHCQGRAGQEVQLRAFDLDLLQRADDLVQLGAHDDRPAILDTCPVIALAELGEQHRASVDFLVVPRPVRQDLADSEPLCLLCEIRRSAAVAPHEDDLSGEDLHREDAKKREEEKNLGSEFPSRPFASSR
jgi:hypothetical protein